MSRRVARSPSNAAREAKSGAPTTRGAGRRDPRSAFGNRAMLRLLAAMAGGDPSAPQPVVQRKARGPRVAGSAESVAAAGVQGMGGSLPHRSTLKRAFAGHDLSGIRSHVGPRAAAASRALGAEAYAFGDRVAFAEPRPSLFTAAHETAHVLQQRQGVQLAGGVGRVGDRYEENADAVAEAVVAGKRLPPILGGGGGGPAVQRRSKLHKFVDKQRQLTDEEREGHTTVGFEFEFAKMTDAGPLHGRTHVEIGESSRMDRPPLPFVLETDAGDALELVTPPFWLPTFGDRLLPRADAVDGVIGLFQRTLGRLVDGEPTIGQVVTSLRSNGIDMALRPVGGDEPVARETMERIRLETLKKARPEAESGAEGIATHVNIATDASGDALLNQGFRGDRLSDDEIIREFTDLEDAVFATLVENTMGRDHDEDADLRARVAERIEAHKETLEGQAEGLEEAFHAKAATVLDNRPRKRAAFEDEATAAKDDILSSVDAIDPEVLRRPLVMSFDVARLAADVSEVADRIDTGFHDLLERLNSARAFWRRTVKPRDIAFVSRGPAVALAARRALRRVPLRGEDDPALSAFLRTLARTIAGQMAVPAIEARREHLIAPDLDQARFQKFCRLYASRVKDVRGVWAKASLLDIGLGVLSHDAWGKVRRALDDHDVKDAIHDSLRDSHKSARRGLLAPHAPIVQADEVWPHVDDLMTDVVAFIEAEHLAEVDHDDEPVVSNEERMQMSVMDDRPIDFMEHHRSLMTPRQDTLIPPDQVTMPDIWGDKTRQYVVELRTDAVERLRRIQELGEFEDGF